MEETKVQEVDINDLVQDKRNFNKGNEQARLYILTDCGGSFEKFAEWGLIRAQDV